MSSDVGAASWIALGDARGSAESVEGVVLGDSPVQDQRGVWMAMVMLSVALAAVSGNVWDWFATTPLSAWWQRVALGALVLLVFGWGVGRLVRRNVRWRLRRAMARMTCERSMLVLQMLHHAWDLPWWRAWPRRAVDVAMLRTRWPVRLPVVFLGRLPTLAPAAAIGETMDLVTGQTPWQSLGKWRRQLFVIVLVFQAFLAVRFVLRGDWFATLPAILLAAAFLLPMWFSASTAMLTPGRLEVFQSWRFWGTGRTRVFTPRDSMVLWDAKPGLEGAFVRFIREDGHQVAYFIADRADKRDAAEVLARWGLWGLWGRWAIDHT
jgi:hypothetical protein